MKPQRKAVKAGKHERIRTLLSNIHAERNRFDDNIMLAEAMDHTGSDRLTAGKETAFAGHSDAWFAERP